MHDRIARRRRRPDLAALPSPRGSGFVPPGPAPSRPRTRLPRSVLPACLALLVACGGSGGGASDPVVPPGGNVLPLSVNGVHCLPASYVDEPCVEVTVCVPGTTTCHAVDGILLDTGSYGLRVFRQALGVSLPLAAAPGGGTLAECVHFADGTADWGPVATADVVLGGEPAVRVPVQIVDSTFGAVPASCGGPEAAPTYANGVLGVGPFAEDCGPACTISGSGMYFRWSGTSVSSVAVPLSAQVQNPVAHLGTDGNGLTVVLPAVPSTGAVSVEGSLVLGLDTRSNNPSSAGAVLPLDGYGEFTTTIAGGSALSGSFTDTGSNGLFFSPPSAIPGCSTNPGWYCPATPLDFQAALSPSPGASGGASTVSFQIASIDALLADPASRGSGVFATIGGPGLPSSGFDWGLPFFLGRRVSVGIAGRTSGLGAGPVLGFQVR